MADPGYTLPVFAVAAAKAALSYLLFPFSPSERPWDQVSIDLLEGADHPTQIEIEQGAKLTATSALAITRSQPGDNLDLTRGTPVWAWVAWEEEPEALTACIPLSERIRVQGGEGLGHHADGSPAIYGYARRLLQANLEPLLPESRNIRVQLILPQGRRLAQRTSNAAFGVVEGLALVGTQGIAQPMAATDFLEQARQQLRQVLSHHSHLVLCIGGHGAHVAQTLGAAPDQIVQAANWIGPLLVEAALVGAGSVRLVGYHGKLIKLAGGIFNTSSHMADARLEILAAALIRRGAGADLARQILQLATVDQAQTLLSGAGWAHVVFSDLAQQIQIRAQDYIYKYAERHLPVGVVLFDRQGSLWADRQGDEQKQDRV